MPKKLLDDLLEASLNGVVVYKAIRDAQGEIFDFEFELVNRVAAATMRQPPEALIGKRLNDLFPSREKGGFRVFVEIAETGKPQFWENHFQHEDYDNYYEVSAVRFRRDGVLVTFNDITERKRATEKVRALQRLDLIVNNLPALVAYLSPDYRYQFINETYFRWFGEEARDWVGKGLREVLGEEVFAFLKPNLDTALKGEPISFEFTNPREKLHNHVLQVQYLPDVDENGTVRGLFSLIHDITEPVQTREALKKSEASYRFLADSMPQLVWVTDALGNSIYFNRRWTEYTGQSIDGFALPDWIKVIHPDDLDVTNEAWALALNQSGVNYSVEHRLRDHRTGGYRWFLSRGTPMRDGEGRIIGWFGTSTDIHEQKGHREELERKNEELYKLNASLDELLFTAFQNLESPVIRMEGLIDLLREVASAEISANPDFQSVTGLLRESIALFRHTLLDLSDQEIERAASKDVEEVDLQNLIEEIRLGLWQEISASRAMFRVDTVACPAFRFSRKNLRSIIFNLVSNALKYRSPERPPLIRITAACNTDNSLMLTIKDNGIGIDERDQVKIFSMFKRLHQHVEGAGLGLYIMRRIVDVAGGRIEVESELGKGSTFRVILPEQ